MWTSAQIDFKEITEITIDILLHRRLNPLEKHWSWKLYAWKMGTSVPEVKLNNSLLFSIHNYFIRLCLVSQDKSQSAFKNI